MTKEEIMEKVFNLEDKQIHELEAFLEYRFSPDEEDFIVLEKKRELYHKYIKSIAPKIAIVEVYCHNLPRQISGLIETIFRILAAASVEDDKDDEIKLYDVVLEYEEFLINTLYMFIIDIYTKEVVRYCKNFGNFNCNAIELENGIMLMNDVHTKFKTASRFYKRAQKKFRKAYNIGFWEYQLLLNKLSFWDRFVIPEISVGVSKTVDLRELDESYVILEKLVEGCENNYAKVIHNGYVPGFWKRLVYKYIPGIVSFLLTAWGAFLLYKRMVGIGL